MIAVYYFQIIFCTFLFACNQPEYTSIHLQNEDVLTFLDPLGDVFVIVSSDTLSDNTQEKLIISEYRARKDTNRKILCRFDQLVKFKCDTFSVSNSLQMEYERIMILHGLESINDSGLFEIAPSRKVSFIRYNEMSYLLTFCNKEHYFRLNFVDFGSEDLFRQAIKDLNIK